MEKKDVVLAYCMAFDPHLFNRNDTYRCQKGGVINAPNSYVYMLCRRFDGDYRVKSFSHRTVRYEFFHPRRRAVASSYFDFDLRMIDGSRRLLHVTPCFYVHTPVEEAVIEAADSTALELGASFELWTEIEIFGNNPEYMKSVIRYIMDRRYLDFIDE